MKMSLPSGGWVEPFTFSEGQRESLLDCWSPRRQPERRETAVLFIDSAERIVEHWPHMSFLTPNQRTGGYRKAQTTKLKQVVAASEKLKKCLEALDENTCAMLETEFLRPPYLYDLEKNSRQLDLLLNLFEESANNIISQPHRTGPSTDHLLNLVTQLARSYTEHFNTPPSTRNNSVFVQFINKIAVILGLTIGPATIRSAVPKEPSPPIQKAQKLHASDDKNSWERALSNK